MLKQCEGTLVRICLFYTRNNPEDFRDLYQEILCALWKSWPSFRGEWWTVTFWMPCPARAIPACGSSSII